ncbi:hypothetical protein [Corynebacterium sp. TAE3-ERU30]|nr:hypothetical protein [Corynebacterium sp. TAE3-ERU30]
MWAIHRAMIGAAGGDQACLSSPARPHPPLRAHLPHRLSFAAELGA